MQITIFKVTIALDGTVNISPIFYKKPLCVLIILQLFCFGGCVALNNKSNMPVYLSDKDMGSYVINSNKSLIPESFNILSAQSNTHKVALIISNTYKGKYLLDSSKKDAQEMESVLKSKGFEVLGGSAHMDLSKKSIMELLDRLKKSIANEDNPRVVFYFSGHGYNNNGEDYLVSNSVASKDDINKEGISLHEVYEHLPNTGLNIIFIDACRDLIIPNYNYFGSSEKANIPPNTFIDYGTSFASVSAAGKSSSEASKHTSLLAKAITESKPSESLESIHYKVANELNEKTNFSQRSVFNKGAHVTAAEETLSGYSALFFNETEKGSKSDAIKLLQRF